MSIPDLPLLPLRKRPPKRKQNRQLEQEHQIALIDWAAVTRIPAATDIVPGAFVADYLFAIPNGGGRGRAEAGLLKAQGVKPGVWDLMLPVARLGYNGLWIEMKAPPTLESRAGQLSDEQQQWQKRMLLAGYACAPCWDWWSTTRIILAYLESSLGLFHARVGIGGA